MLMPKPTILTTYATSKTHRHLHSVHVISNVRVCVYESWKVTTHCLVNTFDLRGAQHVPLQNTGELIFQV